MVEGILFIVVGSSLFFYSLSFHDGGDVALSAALFPGIMTLMIALLGGVLVAQHFKSKGKEVQKKNNSDSGLNMRNMWLVFFISLAYVFILPLLHFFIATVIYLAVFLYLTGERRVWMLGSLSLGTVAAIYLVFQRGLGVLLP